MLDTSWKATGLVQPIWDRLDVEKDKRGELARLTGIPGTTLSGLNTGRLSMTIEMATRIADAVEGVTVLDLGAREAQAGVAAQSALDRLAALEGDHVPFGDFLLLVQATSLLAKGDTGEALRVLSEVAGR